jgi:phosphoribosylamine--glycine ligase
MRVLVVGGGGREHALVWRLVQSPSVTEVAAAPGNAGMAALARLYPVAADDVPAQVELASSGGFDLVVVGPEAALAAGLADALVARGVPVFGCSRAAAQIEASKQFAKRLMENARIPTARSLLLEELPQRSDFLARARELGSERLVVKADGLAAGKGVVICDDVDAAFETTSHMLAGTAAGAAGQRVVLEEFLVGREASCMALVDGDRFWLLEACEDHKTVGDGDRGPMTGGMGAISPTPVVNDALRVQIEREVFAPAAQALVAEGRPFRGLLYAGLMMTAAGPRVLEFNCRFGDPETQPLMARFAGDLGTLLRAVACGETPPPPRFSAQSACCVVLCAEGYPGAYRQGDPIEGLAEAEKMEGVVVFHAGTRRVGEQVVTAGGRVLGVTAVGDDMAQARQRAYAAAERIRFAGVHYRRDIGVREGLS